MKAIMILVRFSESAGVGEPVFFFRLPCRRFYIRGVDEGNANWPIKRSAP